MGKLSFPSTVFAVKTSISLHLLLILLDSIAVAYIQSLRKDGLQGGRPRESYEFRCLLVDPTWTHDPKEVPMVLRKNWAGRSQWYLGKSHFPKNPKLAFCECTALLHVP